MFSKKKKKIESRVRFQNSRFKHQLREARDYKRHKRTFPKTDWEVFFSSIGLGSLLSKLLTLLVFLLLIYLVYIPNIFFVKHINITGASPEITANAEASVNLFLNKNLPWPEKNLALLSKNGLKAYLLKTNKQILSVDSINKKLPNTLTIKVTPRLDWFALQTPAGEYFSISNDGIITNQVAPDASGTLPSGLILIKLNQNSNINLEQGVLNQSKVNFIKGLYDQLPGVAKSPINYFEINDLQTPDINVYLQNGLLLKFGLLSNLTETLNRLGLLYAQFAPSELKRLYYIDMRFLDRGYICYQGTACSSNTPTSNATSTPQ
ncbi:MAG TPA: hypothetical protein VE973_02700 [Candidatus Limnocylindria bacterium]|nr:hypothetical protein [Candidatus Limnocylindria bacterium]